MEGAKDRAGSFACLAGLAACLTLSGCIVPEKLIDARVKAALLSPEFTARIDTQVSKTVQQSVGDQSGWLNIGSVALDGSIWAVAIIVGAAALWFWRRSRKAVKTTDVLISHLEMRGVGLNEKCEILTRSTAHKIEPFLNKRVHKVRAERAKMKKKEKKHER